MEPIQKSNTSLHIRRDCWDTVHQEFSKKNLSFHNKISEKISKCFFFLKRRPAQIDTLSEPMLQDATKTSENAKWNVWNTGKNNINRRSLENRPDLVDSFNPHFLNFMFYLLFNSKGCPEIRSALPTINQTPSNTSPKKPRSTKLVRRIGTTVNFCTPHTLTIWRSDCINPRNP